MKHNTMNILYSLIIFFNLSSCQSTSSESSVKEVGANTSLQALVEMVFIDNADRGEYSAAVSIQMGQMKTGSQLDAVDKNGKRFSFKVIEMKLNDQVVTSASPGDTPFVVLQTAGKANGFDQGFYLVNIGSNYPGGSEKVPSVNAAASDARELAATLNGKPWLAGSYYGSALFYAKGLQGVSDQPYLQLSFKAFGAPDSRQLDFQVRDFKEKPGLVQLEGLEAGMSGSALGKSTESHVSGNHQSGNAKNPKTPFQFEISSWKRVSATEAEISGTFSGKLYGFMSKEVDLLEAGVFQHGGSRFLPKNIECGCAFSKLKTTSHEKINCSCGHEYVAKPSCDNDKTTRFFYNQVLQ
ncbi:MAG: hypothetical protein IPL65_17600 [Lewinellaceae bacterium]|nr:hypothetical protein [Lewinellaceae bacterium]